MRIEQKTSLANYVRSLFVLFSLLAFVFCSACAHKNSEPEIKVKGQYDLSVGGTW